MDSLLCYRKINRDASVLTFHYYARMVIYLTSVLRHRQVPATSQHVRDHVVSVGYVTARTHVEHPTRPDPTYRITERPSWPKRRRDRVGVGPRSQRADGLQ